MIRRLPSFFISSRDSTSDADNFNATPPSPCTDSSASPFLVAETRTTRTQAITTTKTTTETMTHAFAIVEHHAGSYSRREAADVRQGTNYGAGSSRSFAAVDKALPPTPPSPSVSFDSPRSSVSHKPKPVAHPSPSISQMGTSFGLCLAPDLFNHPTLSAGTTLSFPRLPADFEKPLPLPLRKAKSTNRLIQKNPSPPDDDLRPRPRVVSFGAVSWLTTTVDAKGKGKEKSKDKNPAAAPTSPKVLSRKASFRSRQKNSATDALTSPEVRSKETPSSISHVPALPLLNFVSDFGLNESDNTSPPFPVRHCLRPLSIARRHSEHLPLSATEFEFQISLPPIETATDNGSGVSPGLNSPSSLHQLSYLAPGKSGPGTPVRSPRARVQTNPHLLHRFSTSLFSFSDTSPLQASPKHSATCTNPRDVPKPLEGTESPGVYVSRLRSVVSKAEMAGILASSSDPFYVDALRCYLHQFDFHDEPLDIALRKLLMEVGLPRETQQIDRVMEAFSCRYSECNPGLFESKDHGYVLAFSLIMLHTDAFNPSNKSKMTKADYIKNTSLAGLPSEALGCYYDNIVFAPFIFIEDTNGHLGTHSETPQTPSTPSTGILGKKKIDPYYLISHNLLHSMGSDVERHVPLGDPFSYCGTGSHPWSDEELEKAFSTAGVIAVEPTSGEHIPAHFGNGLPAPFDGPSSKTIKVTKVGVLNRKDDIGMRGKRNTIRKWRSWTVLLTGSQLLFFKDSSLAEHILNRLRSTLPEHSTSGSLSGGTLLKPDEILSVKDAIAVYDKTYRKHDHTLRFVLSNGRQILLQAPTAQDMDKWITKINYSSAFKSAGVQIRPLGMSPDETQMTGVAAAASLLHDVQLTGAPPSVSIQPWDSSVPHALMGMLSANSLNQRPTLGHRLTIAPCQDVDLDSPSAVDAVTSQQFQTTFDRVKANLSQDSPYLTDEERSSLENPPVCFSTSSNSSRPLTRSDIIRRKVDDLRSKLAATESHLDADLRFVRNIAILKPFQGATRARLLNPVENIARKVMQLRLEAVRLQCHLSVLQRDLESESHSLDQMQSIALEAARKSLDRGSDGALPLTTISLHNSQDQAEMSSVGVLSRSWSNSSISESFRSASALELKYRSDWPAEDMNATPISLSPSHLFDSPRPSQSSSSTPCRTSNESRSSVLQRSASYSSSAGGSPQELNPSNVVIEEAEVWNKTRCAHRVSLIRVPSTISFTHRPEGWN